MIIDTFEYDTYGRLISRTGTVDTPFLYNGRDGVMTDHNGLIYMRNRYYSPLLRRFVNADVLHGSISDSTSLNRYAYVNGNPVSFIDPLGLSAEREINNSTKQKVNAKIDWVTTPFKVEYRNDINGIGLLLDGTILAGRNVTNDDIIILINIAMMTSYGFTETEIINFVNDYNESLNGDTVIRKDKTLDYYTAFEDITNKLINEFLVAEYENTMFYGNDGNLHRISEVDGVWPAFLFEFYNNVKNGAPWDLKQEPEWQQSSLYYFNGELVDADAPGNIMFGYMGKSYGIPGKVLHLGAGFAQVKAGTSSWEWMQTLFDDPMDAANIDRGIEFFKEGRSSRE